MGRDGIVWYGISYGTLWRGMVWHGPVRFGKVRCSAVVLVLHGIVEY